MIKPEFVLEKCRQIGRLRDKYEMGSIDKENLTTYEHFLVSEWDRCKTLPLNTNPGLVLNKEQFDLVKIENRVLLDKSLPVLKDTANMMTEVPALLVLSDRFGNVLKIVGDRNVRKKAEKVSIMEGAVWREDITGNNGIGTAIFRKEPVFVTSAEHYWGSLETFCCTGTPILRPNTSEVLGVIDVTCLKDSHSKDAAILTHLLANQIHLEYKLDMSRDKFDLIGKYLELLKKYPEEPIVVMDLFGNFIEMNQKSRNIINNNNVIEDEAVYSEDIVSTDSIRVIGKYCILRKPIRSILIINNILPSAYGEFITLNTELVKMMESVKKIATTNVSVLINGESGTGKELVAKYIHEQSNNKEGPFVAVNCAQITSDLYASAFFGYEKGAFTGADSRGRKGFFELAHGGTLFLDEIGDMPLIIQAALLRVIETKSFTRLGSEKVTDADFRIIAATNRQLDKEVTAGRFREDLYFRLKVASFSIPPLRKRPEDLEYLIRHFSESYCLKNGFNYPGFDPKVMEVFLKYFWPGNVRELKNVIELMVIYGEGNMISSNIPEELIKMHEDNNLLKTDDNCSITALKQEEPNKVVLALQKHEKKYLAAKELGISRSTLYRRLKKINKTTLYTN